MKHVASASSNIALIKYMGKTNSDVNLPTNSSLSYTLNDLRSYVELELNEDLAQDTWLALHQLGGERFTSITLSDVGQRKFLNHFLRLKQEWGIKENFYIRSANNFPSDCGLASSASSFAALTIAASQLFQEMKPKAKMPDATELAKLSRLGSGSSCRSFFSPWCMWQTGGDVRSVDLPYQNLLHQVVVISASKKEVSSSEAHQRVTSSPLFAQRPQRAETRLSQLILALRNSDWDQARQICWDEFIDMHELFETSQPSFSYINDDVTRVLMELQKIFKDEKDGAIVTMDAGPNIHLLYRSDQTFLKQKVHTHFSKEFKIL